MISGGNPFWLLDGRVCIHIGDVFERLCDLPDDSVDCVVTSPPYWGLRDYGTAFWVEGDPRCEHRPIATTRTPWANRIKGPHHTGKHGTHDTSPARAIGGHCALCGARRVDYQIGLESTLGQHLEVMVAVFAEIWRVVKPHGSVWLNYGDCYAAAPNGRSAAATKAAGDDDRTFRDKPFSTVGPIYQPDFATPRGVFTASDLGHGGVGTRRIDHGGRVVAGGMLKEKDLCMIPNRLAIALQEWGWWVRSEIIWGKENAMPDSSGNGRPSTAHEKIFLLTKSADADVWRARDTGELSFQPDLSERCRYVSKRDPETGELVENAPRWIRLGAWYDAGAVMQPSSPSTRGRLLRNFEEAPVTVWNVATRSYKDAHFATFPPELVALAIAAGAPPMGGVVLDPFGGSGTTALVAVAMGRRAHLIELKPEYAAMAKKRLEREFMGSDERRRDIGKERHDALRAEGKLEPLPLIEVTR